MSEIERIEGKKCKNCGFLQSKDHIRCIKCKNNSFDKLEAKGNCTLLTYTILNATPMEFGDKNSLILGVVEFENGIKAFGQITSRENLRIGMKLSPVYDTICKNFHGNELKGYLFKPIQ